MNTNPKQSILSRREFMKRSALCAVGVGLLSNQPLMSACCPAQKEPFKLSLAQWSLHRNFFEGKLNPLDFPVIAKNEFNISAVEYVNQFFKDKAHDKKYLGELNLRAADNGVKNILIMVDGEGNMGASEEKERTVAIENHYKWIDAANELGCHSIRVNAGGPGDRETLATAVIDGLGRLAEYGQKTGINVIVENHGGFSSDAAWLSKVIAKVNMANCGTLPDFGNFCIKRIKDENGNRTCVEEYDRYLGTSELMPWAKAVSAKSHEFDATGNEIHTDYFKMMKIVLEAGYHGYVGIEYEGKKDDEYTGIKKTRDLLLKVRNSIQ